MEYGNTKETITLDDHGSTVTTERNIVNHIVIKPIRKRYEYKIRIHSKKEELEAYLAFSDSLDTTKLDPAFRIEHSKIGDKEGYTYAVKCWTELIV